MMLIRDAVGIESRESLAAVEKGLIKIMPFLPTSFYPPIFSLLSSQSCPLDQGTQGVGLVRGIVLYSCARKGDFVFIEIVCH